MTLLHVVLGNVRWCVLTALWAAGYCCSSARRHAKPEIGDTVAMSFWNSECRSNPAV